MHVRVRDGRRRGRASCASSSRRASSRRSCAGARFTEVAGHHGAHLRHLPGRLPDERDRRRSRTSAASRSPSQVRALRRLLYCGEWIESHALHVFLLHAPDFLGYAERDSRWRATTGEVVERGAAAQEGRQRADARRRRARDPPDQRARRRLLPRADARPSSRRRSRAAPARPASSRSRPCAGRRRCPCPDFEEDYDFVALREPDAATRSSAGGSVVEQRARPRAVASTTSTSSRSRSPHSTALHSRLRDGTRYLVGPLARYALNRDRLSPRRRARPPTPRASSRCAATRFAASSCARSRSSTRSTRRCG